MIVTESMTINGKSFIKTYSDSGYMVEREGIRYSEAIDPAEYGRTYTETEELAYTDDPNEATDADYQAALEEMGCSFDD